MKIAGMQVGARLRLNNLTSAGKRARIALLSGWLKQQAAVRRQLKAGSNKHNSFATIGYTQIFSLIAYFPDRQSPGMPRQTYAS